MAVKDTVRQDRMPIGMPIGGGQRIVSILRHPYVRNELDVKRHSQFMVKCAEFTAKAVINAIKRWAYRDRSGRPMLPLLIAVAVAETLHGPVAHSWRQTH
jgi:hypothetical protein